MGKNSFVLYSEYIDHVNTLSDEQSGTLFKAILNYVNDIDLPEMDGAVGMAFSFIKKQLDRDAEKYEETIEKRRNAGRASGEARRNKSEQTRTKRTSVKSVQQTRTKRTDNVYVNDNVDVNVNDNDIKKIKDTPPKPSPKTVTSMIEERGYSPTLKDAVLDWVKYKRERKEGYVETGLTKLLTEIANNAKEFGDDAVIDIINKSIAAQWKGILWKALKEERDANKGTNPWADYRDPYEEWRQKGEGVGGDTS